MNKVRFTMNYLALVVFTLTFASYAHAQTRTWVSGVGSDLNPCSRTAPCKTFSKAHSITAASGEINALDAGGYGTLTITKSITVDGGESYSSILAAGTTGVIVNAPGAHVILRNLSINGVSNGVDGIRVLQAASVKIENVKILGFTGQGIDWAPLTAGGILTVRNATISNCTAGGISIINSSGVGRSSIESSTFHRGAFGVKAGANGVVTVSDSTATATTDGFLAIGGGAEMNLDRCTATQNTNGVNVDLGGTIRISNCLISINFLFGLKTTSGTIESYGTNMIRGNPLNDAPTAVLKS